MSHDISNKYTMTSEQNEARFQEAYDSWSLAKENNDQKGIKDA